ncbi:MAG: M23 family metallopeptidase [Halanaerobacter sp.]
MSKKKEDKLPFSISGTKNKLRDKLKKLKKLGWKEYLAIVILFTLLGGVVAYYQKSSQLDSLQHSSQDNELDERGGALDDVARSQINNTKSQSEQETEIGKAVSTDEEKTDNAKEEPKENSEEKSEEEHKKETQEEAASLPQMSSESLTSQFENLIRPLKGEITSHCEWYKDKTLDAWKYNPGVNIKGEIGAPIKSVAQGKVKKVLRDDYKGLTIIIEHNQIYSSLYSNLEEAKVEVGEKVNKKQVIAKLGDSGPGDESRLHFEIIKEEKRVDPMNYFN